MKLERRGIKRGRVEMIPMIDTILILLIFYMSFSAFTSNEKRLNATLPLERPGGQPEMEIVMHVRNESEIVVNGTIFDPASLQANLDSLNAAKLPLRVIVEGEAATSYQAIVNVMDACAQAKLTRVAFRPLAL